MEVRTGTQAVRPIETGCALPKSRSASINVIFLSRPSEKVDYPVQILAKLAIADIQQKPT